MNSSTSNSASLAFIWMLTLLVIVWTASAGLWILSILAFLVAVAVTYGNQAPE